FGEYWYGNGGIPSILANYLKTHKINAQSYLKKEMVIKVNQSDFLNPTSLTDIDQNVLMCQTGYLTLRSPTNHLSKILLGIPNNEIYKALTSLLALKVFNNEIDVTDEQGVNIFDNGSEDDIAALLNAIINSVPYDNYPINSESALQSLIMLYLIGAGLEVKSETHSSKGRADLTVDTEKRRIVFEFKYAENDSDAKIKLNEAIEQIKSRDYGNTVPSKSELIRIAAVFNADPAVRSISYELVK
ncbi:MAG: PD-(D/E)XK nuclease domain-containing protein, partial [Succinivibrio sp.]